MGQRLDRQMVKDNVQFKFEHLKSDALTENSEKTQG